MEIIRGNLTDNGEFYLLLPAKREAETESLLKDFNFDLIQKVLVRQTIAHKPFRILIQGGKNQYRVPHSSEIVIKDKDNQYTNEFIALLKDYYLYL